MKLTDQLADMRNVVGVAIEQRTKYHGERYRAGALEAAARAGADAILLSRVEAIDAILRSLAAFRISINPNWDGSIA